MNREHGSAGLLLLLGAAVVCAAAAAAGALVAGSLAHTRADGVADMVALAGAAALLDPDGPCEAAARTATANEAELSSCDVRGAVVRVEVLLGLPRGLESFSGHRRFRGTAAAQMQLDSVAAPPP